MHAQSTIAVALFGASALVSAGSAIVHNKCGFPVYLTPVTNMAGEMTTLHPNDHWSQPFQTNPDGGGISIKMSTSPSLYTGAAITQLEYTVDSTLWYDMSNINGYPFMQWGMNLHSSSSSCRDVFCAPGIQQCDEAYNTPDENENTASCTPDADLELTLCSSEHHHRHHANNNVSNAVSNALDVATGNDDKHKHHHKHHDKKHHHNDSDHKKHHDKHHHHHHQAPAPIAVPAPAPVAAAATTFVTQVVTVTARNAEPSADAHAHANYHRHHFQRRS